MDSKNNLIVEDDYGSCAYYLKGYCVADGKPVRCYRELNNFDVSGCDIRSKQTKMLEIMAFMINELKGGESE